MRFTTILVIYLVAFNAGAQMMYSTGVAADLGLNVQTGNPEELQQAEDLHEDVEIGPGTGLTLIGMIANVGRGIADAFTAVMPGLRMLGNVGVPDHWIVFAGTVSMTVVGFNVASWLRGVRS